MKNKYEMIRKEIEIVAKDLLLEKEVLMGEGVSPGKVPVIQRAEIKGQIKAYTRILRIMNKFDEFETDDKSEEGE